MSEYSDIPHFQQISHSYRDEIANKKIISHSLV